MTKDLRDTLEVHVTPGLDAAAAARAFIRDGAVGVDDFAENLYDVVIDEILEHLGHAPDDRDHELADHDSKRGALEAQPADGGDVPDEKRRPRTRGGLSNGAFVDIDSGNVEATLSQGLADPSAATS